MPNVLFPHKTLKPIFFDYLNSCLYSCLLDRILFNTFVDALLCFFMQDVCGVTKDFAGFLKSVLLVVELP